MTEISWPRQTLIFSTFESIIIAGQHGKGIKIHISGLFETILGIGFQGHVVNLCMSQITMFVTLVKLTMLNPVLGPG